VSVLDDRCGGRATEGTLASRVRHVRRVTQVEPADIEDVPGLRLGGYPACHPTAAHKHDEKDHRDEKIPRDQGFG